MREELLLEDFIVKVAALFIFIYPFPCFIGTLLDMFFPSIIAEEGGIT